MSVSYSLSCDLRGIPSTLYLTQDLSTTSDDRLTMHAEAGGQAGRGGGRVGEDGR